MALSNTVPVDYLELWYKALALPFGLVVRIEGPRKSFRARLYAARAASQDPELQRLSLVLTAADPQEICIVHKVIDIPDEQA